MISAAFVSKFGSGETIYRFRRCGLSPCLTQTRATRIWLNLSLSASLRELQWVVPSVGRRRVASRICASILGALVLGSWPRCRLYVQARHVGVGKPLAPGRDKASAAAHICTDDIPGAAFPGSNHSVQASIFRPSSPARRPLSQGHALSWGQSDRVSHQHDYSL